MDNYLGILNIDGHSKYGSVTALSQGNYTEIGAFTQAAQDLTRGSETKNTIICENKIKKFEVCWGD